MSIFKNLVLQTPLFLLLIILVFSAWNLLRLRADDARRKRAVLTAHCAAVLLTAFLLYNGIVLRERFSDHEKKIAALQSEYDKAVTEAERWKAAWARSDREIQEAQKKVLEARTTARREFESAVRAIRKEYKDISDEALNRRIDDIVGKSRRRLQP